MKLKNIFTIKSWCAYLTFAINDSNIDNSKLEVLNNVNNRFSDSWDCS